MAISYKIYRAWVSEYQALPELDANANAVAIQHRTGDRGLGTGYVGAKSRLKSASARLRRNYFATYCRSRPCAPRVRPQGLEIHSGSAGKQERMSCAHLPVKKMLKAWECSRELPEQEAALSLLALASPERSWDELAKLPLRERNALLLELRAMTLGRRMNGFAVCMDCGAQLEFCSIRRPWHRACAENSGKSRRIHHAIRPARLKHAAGEFGGPVGEQQGSE